jgi:hypothetical protein
MFMDIVFLTDMMMKSEAWFGCDGDNDCHKPSVVKVLRCPVHRPPVCFNNVCACDPSGPPRQIHV